jgi:hypothetical protein
MNFQITTLAETMSASGFIIELNERKINYDVQAMDDPNNANEGDCIVSIGDMCYRFSDGELLEVAFDNAPDKAQYDDFERQLEYMAGAYGE